jgi:hypothetical protein
LKEDKRTTSGKGTKINYHLESSGFPSGKTYSVWIMRSGDHKTFPVVTGYSADATQKLACPSQLQAGAFAASASRCIPLENVSLDIDHYHNGEPADFAVVSTDGVVRAYACAYPFPIQAQDGKCVLSVEIESKKFTSFVIRGAGFEPGEQINTSSSFGKDAAAAAQRASTQGEFTVAIQADAPGKDSGSATFAAAGSSCKPTVTFDWGKAAMKVQ